MTVATPFTAREIFNGQYEVYPQYWNDPLKYQIWTVQGGRHEGKRVIKAQLGVNYADGFKAIAFLTHDGSFQIWNEYRDSEEDYVRLLPTLLVYATAYPPRNPHCAVCNTPAPYGGGLCSDHNSVEEITESVAEIINTEINPHMIELADREARFRLITGTVGWEDLEQLGVVEIVLPPLAMSEVNSQEVQ